MSDEASKALQPPAAGGDPAVTRRTALKASGAAAAMIAAAHPLLAARRDGTTIWRDVPFDQGWRFFFGDPAEAARPDFADAQWRDVDLPHDWSFEERPGAPRDGGDWIPPVALWNATERPKDAKPINGSVLVMAQVPPPVPGSPPHRVGPFDTDRSVSGWSSGWTVGGVGWYRKAFTLDDLTPGEQVEIRFDGAYRETELWINGVSLGRSVNGYLGFVHDLTPHLRGGDNILAVRVTNEGHNSRWYSGSGIYRHVWLNRTGGVRVPLWGVNVVTVSADARSAVVALTVDVENRAASTAAECRIVIKDDRDRTVARSTRVLDLGGGAAASTAFDLTVSRPSLWSPEAPALYTAEVELAVAGRASDRIVQRFGIRTLAVSADRGFRINGVSYKLRGACVHHDNGLLGAAAHDDAERRKVELLKASGYNAVRCSHNPFSPHFLDVCDELGMIVVEDAFDIWEKEKVADDYHIHFADHWRRDLAGMVRRDRNHPSIAFSCIGNEIPEIDKPRGAELAREMRGVVLALDRNRFVTSAVPPQSLNAGSEAARAQLDVIGYNYVYQWMAAGHEKTPAMVAMSTESWPKDALDIWRNVESQPYNIGDFVWTALDYLGEVGCGSWRIVPGKFKPRTGRLDFNSMRFFVWDFPAYQSSCGDIDLLGMKKPAGAYRDVVWKRSPLQMFVQRPTPPGMAEEVAEWGWFDELASWTWSGHEGKPIIVRAYTLGDEVTLLRDGREVGRKALGAGDRATAEFTIPYAPGRLEAIAYRGGQEIGRHALASVGKPARLHLRTEPHRHAGAPGGLVYVFAEVHDADGRLVPDAAVPIRFATNGGARLLRAGSANPRGLESYQDDATRTFHVVALAILQGGARTGKTLVRVESPGLASGETTI